MKSGIVYHFRLMTETAIFFKKIPTFLKQAETERLLILIVALCDLTVPGSKLVLLRQPFPFLPFFTSVST